jgi:diguanylate cyclase (GGDEF)-like protein
MADIDLFKSFNDTYGHPAGDACLQAVSTALAGVLRGPGDMAARLGGEEFGILLPATDAAGAADIAWKAQEAVRLLRIEHDGSPHGIVTLSLGVAGRAPSDTTTWGTLIAAADRALYQAKADGRDTAVIDDGPPLAPAPGPRDAGAAGKTSVQGSRLPTAMNGASSENAGTDSPQKIRPSMNCWSAFRCHSNGKRSRHRAG